MRLTPPTFNRMDRTTIPSSSDFTIAGMLAILERTPNVLHALLAGLDEEWTHHNEGGDTWTPYDVVGHLVHGERTDWLVRIRKCLSANDKAFERFDRTAMFTGSRGKSMDDLLDEFAALRHHNLAAFGALGITAADLGSTGLHPTFGEVSLRQLLATWAAHDLGHLTQITRVMCKQYRNEVGPWKEFISVLR